MNSSRARFYPPPTPVLDWGFFYRGVDVFFFDNGLQRPLHEPAKGVATMWASEPDLKTVTWPWWEAAKQTIEAL